MGALALQWPCRVVLSWAELPGLYMHPLDEGMCPGEVVSAAQAVPKGQTAESYTLTALPAPGAKGLS